MKNHRYQATHAFLLSGACRAFLRKIKFELRTPGVVGWPGGVASLRQVSVDGARAVNWQK